MYTKTACKLKSTLFNPIDRGCLYKHLQKNSLKRQKQVNEVSAFFYITWSMTHLTSPEPSNPWTSDDSTFWDLEASKEPSKKRVKWGFSLEEALKYPAGQVLAGCTGVKEGGSTGSCTEALMKSDSYSRFLQSNLYQELLMVRKKPEMEQGKHTSLVKFNHSVGNSLMGI
uniref:RGS domain-containing protein n=1 Tax=Oreochromis niloticus TaxID=8128 RepID=A0A669AXR9_ORENI